MNNQNEGLANVKQEVFDDVKQELINEFNRVDVKPQVTNERLAYFLTL